MYIQLVDRLAESLDRLYREQKQQFFTCALAVVRSPERAEDAVHDAFAKLFALQRMPRNLKAYAFRTVRNAAIDILRNTQRDYAASTNGKFIYDDRPTALGTAADWIEVLTTSLASLSDNERTVITLHLHSDLTFREIASVLKCPIGSVSSWYQRGTEKLRVRIKD